MRKSDKEIKGLNIWKMTGKDVEFVIGMTAEEGWNPGIHDGEIFYETYPDGFFIAEIEGKGGGKVPEGLVKITDVSFENLVEYDREMFPAPRSAFLEKWIKQPDSHSFAAIEAGKLKGYGVIRKCQIGY